MRPLRVAAETARAAVRASGDLDDDDGDRSTTSFVASTVCRCEGRGGVRLPRPHSCCASARLTPRPDRLAWFKEATMSAVRG